MLQITKQIIDCINLEYNECYTAKGKLFDFEGGTVWISIYNESEFDSGAWFTVYQSALCRVTLDNEIIECDGEFITASQIEEEIKAYFYEWNTSNKLNPFAIGMTGKKSYECKN